MVQRFLLSTLIFFSVQLSFARNVPYKKTVKSVSKVEKYYYMGLYRKAFATNEKLLNKQRSFHGASGHEEIGISILRSTLIQQELSDYASMEGNITKGLEVIESNGGTESIQYAEGLCFAMRIWSNYGNLKKAMEYDEQIQKILAKATDPKGRFSAGYWYYRAILMNRAGFYQQAREDASKAIKFRKALITRYGDYIDSKTGTVKSKKLSSKDYAQRKRNYADALNLMMEVYVTRGDNKTAKDSLYKRNRKWIENNLGKDDISAVWADYLKALTIYNRRYYKTAMSKMEKVLEATTKAKGVKFTPTSKKYEEIYEKVMMCYFWRGENREVLSLKAKYKSYIEREFKKDGVRQGNRVVLEAEDFLINKVDSRKASIELESRHKKSEERLVKIVKNHEFFPDISPGRAYVLKRLSKIYANSDRISEARNCIKEYMAIYDALYPQNSPAYHMGKCEEGVFLSRYTNEFQNAEKIFNESFNNIVKKAIHPVHKDYFYFQNEVIDLYKTTDRYRAALNLAKSATKTCLRYYGDKEIQYAMQLEQEAALSMDLGEYRTAHKLLSTASEVMQTKIHKFKARLYKTKARYYNTMGNYDLATLMLEKAEKIEPFASVEEYADLYISKGHYGEVEEKLEETIEKVTERFGKTDRRLPSKYQRLGKLHLITGDYTKAEKEIKTAMKIAYKVLGDTSLMYTEAEYLLGQVFLQLGDYYHAELTFRETITKQVGLLGARKQVPVALTINELAKAMYLNNKDRNKVEELFLEAKSIIEDKLGKKNPAYAIVAADLAGFYIDMDKLDIAENLLTQVTAIYKKKLNVSKPTIESANNTLLLGDIAKRKKNYSRALHHYENASNDLKALFDEEHIEYVKSLSRIGQLYYVQGDDKKALKILNETTSLYMKNIRTKFSYLSERGKKEFWDLIRPDFEFYNTIAFKYKDTDPKLIENVYNITLGTKAILLSSSIKLRQSVMSSGNQDLIDKYNKWRSLKEELMVYDSWDNDKIKTEGINKDEIRKNIVELEKQLSDESDAFALEEAKKKRRNEISWEKVAKELKENEYAVEIIRYRFYKESFTDSVIYAALIVEPNAKELKVAIINNGDGKKIEKRYLKYYRNSIKYQTKDKRSYKVFWEPIHKIIGDNSTVYLSTDGAYNQINLEAIPTPDKQYILDKNKIVLVSNTKDIVERAEEERRRKQLIAKGKLKVKKVENTALLIGNPAFYEVRVTPEDTVFVTLSDSVFARTSDRILISTKHGIIAKERHKALITSRDGIYAIDKDGIVIKSVDSIYARERDNIMIRSEDSVPNGSGGYYRTEDKVVAKLEHNILITEDDGIIAKDYHRRLIKASDKIYAKAYHNKTISKYDNVYASIEDKVLIGETDKVVNRAVYNSMKIPQLPGAEKEINQVYRILQDNNWKTNKYSFADANEKVIKEWTKSPRVFHIATHGFFEEDIKKSQKQVQGLSHLKEVTDPLQRSGVMFRNAGDIFKNHHVGAADLNSDNGVLTAAEALTLNFDNTELVILSACETGRGEVAVGEGVYGLQRSFLVGGVQNVVMSLFKVSDAATQELMKLFYTKWVKSGDKRTAFIEAKKELRKNPDFKDPIFWGAFVMIGI